MVPSMDAQEKKFDWDRYLENHGLEPVPICIFQHVEKCQQSLLEAGMMVEVQTNPKPRFWLANVTMKCGPFLRLMHVGQEDFTKEIWTDPVSVEIRPVGYSASRGWPLEPPEDLKHIRSSPLVAKMAEEHRATDCEASLLSPAQQIKTGMTLELEDDCEPFVVWPVKVLRNVGGRLYVEYVIPPGKKPESNLYQKWLFCLSPRLHWQGWASSQAPSSWTFKPPKKLRSLYDDTVEKMTEEFKSVKGKPWQFEEDQQLPVHSRKVGDRVRVIDPYDQTVLHTSTVSQVLDDQRFLITWNDADGERRQLVCFPGETFDQEHGVDKEGHASDGDEEDFSFLPGMVLEATNPWKPDEICVASVTSVDGSLLRIRLEKPDIEEKKRDFYASVASHELFPVGWSDDQHYPLVGPPLADSASQLAQPPETEEKTSNGSEVASGETNEPGASASAASISYWCPKIYFNFRCFTGPLLSRIRVAALPRSVGPGPIGLMMKEVLSLLLNGAYKPGSVLKQLQGESNDSLPPGTQLEPLKAKYRQTTYRGLVPMASTAADVPAYCRWVCDKLQCCPYLFGPELVGDPCPHRCCILAKAVWQHKKKAPNWRHRRFVDILKAGLDPAMGDVVSSLAKSSSGSINVIESTEHSDEEDSDGQPNDSLPLLPPPPPPPVHIEPEEPTVKKKRGRPRKNPLPVVPVPTSHDPKEQRRQSAPVSEDHLKGSAPNKWLAAFVPRAVDLAADTPSPDRWATDEVWRFLQTTDCRPLADCLRELDVDGPSLLMLSPADIMDYVTLDWQWALKLFHLVNCLRLNVRSAHSANRAS